MRNECSVIRDLLPLYAEKMVRPDTADFIEEHLKGCEACREEFQSMKEPRCLEESYPARKTADAAPLLALGRKLKIKRIQTIALTAVFVAALFLSAFAVLDAPIYFPYSEELVTIDEQGEQGMLLTFDEKVTGFDYTVYEDPDGGDFCYCDIQAWTSLWDQWFAKGNGKLSTAVTTGQTKPVIAVYVPNDGSENICIGKYDPAAEDPIEKDVNYGSVTVLPRLSLGYYLLLAIAALAASAVWWLLTRKKAEWRVWAERVGLYPVSYLISFCIVKGISTTSYALKRDFFLILFLSLLLYSGLLLAHNIWRLKKEIKESGG